MSVRKRAKILRKMLSLYDDYTSSPQVIHSSSKNDPIEFVKTHICEKNLFLPENDETITTFYDYCTKKPLLQEICDESEWPNTANGMIFLYITMFLMDENNQSEVLGMVSKQFKSTSKQKISNFLSRHDLNDYIVQKMNGIKIDFVRSSDNNKINPCQLKDTIINEVASKSDLYKSLFEPKIDANNDASKEDDQSKCENKHKTSIITDEIQYIIQDNNFLQKTYSEECMTKLKKDVLEPVKESNQPSSISSKSKLNKENQTNKNSKKSQNIKETTSSRLDQIVPIIRPTKTQILREGADIQKKTAKNEKLLQTLCTGSFDPNSITNLLTEIKESEEETELFEIERKHLLGKISLEEAKIARLNVKQKNKTKAAELKEHQKLLDFKLAKIRELEEEKIRNAIEKSHSIVTAMRTSQQKVLEAKKQNAKNIQQTSKALEEIKLRSEREELDRKMQVIRQIKELEHANGGHFQTMFGKKYELNLRTSCKMTIDELKKALGKMKENISKEINDRRMKILKDKSKQDDMLKSTKEKIAKYRQAKIESNKEEKPKKTELKMNPELLQLKNKLELKKLELAKIERNTSAVLV